MPENTNNQNKENKNPSGFITDPGTGVVIKEEAEWRAVRHYREPQSSKMIQWVMRISRGVVQNEKQASFVLLGFAVVAAGISLYLFFGVLGGGKEVKFSPKVKEEMQRSAKNLLRP